MKTTLKIYLFSFLLFQVINAQFTYIPVNVDYATFKGKENLIYTEIYVSFFQKDLQYIIEEDSQYVARFSQSVQLMQNDSIISEFSKNYRNTFVEGSANLLSQFVEVFPIELAPGLYNLKAVVVDENSNKSGEYLLDIVVKEESNELYGSHIELSSKISTDITDSKFSLKNNIYILPNPSKTFSVFSPLLYFYFEAYNLKSDEQGKSNYQYKYYISDMKGKRVREYPAKEKQSELSTIAEANGINVIALKNGNYNLTVEFLDLNRNESLYIKKKFAVSKPQRKSTNEQIAAKIEGYEEYADFSKNQLMDEFKKLKYIASRNEIRVFKSIEETEGMKRFLSQFWNRRDFNPETPHNEYKQLYFSNLQMVNAQYSTTFKEGWRTDRGRVILIYGQPDEIERFPSSLNSQPYEIWHFYSLEGGSKFIFSDLSGNGNYELLHSTFRNEIKDPDWQLRIGKVRNRQYESSFDDF